MKNHELLRLIHESLVPDDPRRNTLNEICIAIYNLDGRIDFWSRKDGVTKQHSKGHDTAQRRREMWDILHELQIERPDDPNVAELISRYEDKNGYIVPRESDAE